MSTVLSTVEADAEYVRSRLSPQPVEGMLKTPDEMIDDPEWSKYGTGRIALVIKEADKERRRTKGEFDLAHAAAVKASTAKSSDMREADATLACAVEREAAENAEIAYDFAKKVARSVESSASQTQTQASLVKAQLSLAETGRAL